MSIRKKVSSYSIKVMPSAIKKVRRGHSDNATKIGDMSVSLFNTRMTHEEIEIVKKHLKENRPIQYEELIGI